jgi:hypothetical protein
MTPLDQQEAVSFVPDDANQALLDELQKDLTASRPKNPSPPVESKGRL